MANPRKRRLTPESLRESPPLPEPRVSELVVDRRERWGNDALVDLHGLATRPKLAWALWTALDERSQPGGAIGSPSTLLNTSKALRQFWVFLDELEARDQSVVLECRDVTGVVMERFKEWLEGRVSDLTASSRVYTVGILFDYLREHHPALISPNYFTPRGRLYESNVKPLSEREASVLEKALARDLRSIIERVTVEKDRLLALGRDPRTEGAWINIADSFWYVVNVLDGEYPSTQALQESGHGSLLSGSRNGGWSLATLYGYLYLSFEDLWTFLVYLGLTTGLNMQPLIELERDLTQTTPFLPSVKEQTVRVRFVKRRPQHKAFEKVFSTKRWNDPGALLLTLHELTSRAARWAKPDQASRLFLAVSATSKKSRFRPLGEDSDLFHRASLRFVSRHNLKADDGTPLATSYRRLRPTYLTQRFKKGGSLAQVRDDAKHSSADTTLGYVLNEQTRPFLEDLTLETVREMLDFVRRNTLTQSATDTAGVTQVAQLYQINPSRSKRLLSGASEVIFSSCADYYNRPGGSANTPCDRPWACFACRNARWVKRNLPALVLLRDFFLSQRSGMSADDWRLKYGFPYAAITEAILPRFPAATLSWAEAQADGLRERFHIPFALL